MSDSTRTQLGCSDCGTHHCDKRTSEYPPFCLTTATDKARLEEIRLAYQDEPRIAKMFSAAAEIDAEHYCKISRLEEIILFAKKIGAKKVGIATCMGLMTEATIMTKIFKAKGIDDYLCVGCKAGANSKEDVGIPREHKINPDKEFEPACNPILQAEILNNAETDLNILVGLCVGHDAIFTMHAKAPCVTFTVKDKLLQHNPLAAIYGSHSYYRRLLTEDEIG